ncbi:MAG: zinc ABC transporter substrate-binding protein [Candidatus Sabulitectum sp.]|nr:zinc ABC transporter substrate-binding protein [Candidatus Sabulitectum sp.]
MQKIIAAFVMLLLLACSQQIDQIDRSGISVLVSVVPQKYFVEKIAGDLVQVSVLIPPGANPATYEPSPSDMRMVSSADVWFTIGLQMEAAWIPDFLSLNKHLSIAGTIEGVQRLPIGRYGIPGENEEHDHGSSDPHVWLSPELVKLQALAVCDALCEIDPDNCELYSANLARFMEEIDELREDLHLLLDVHAGEGFMVFHPAWGYFADEFELVQVPIEISGSEPSPGELARLVDFGERSSVKVIFVSPQFSESSAETIAHELGATVLFIDPLALNWAENLMYVADELATALE